MILISTQNFPPAIVQAGLRLPREVRAFIGEAQHVVTDDRHGPC